jgi:hypothetical protein
MIMRGDERIQDGMFSYVSLEQRVPVDHPLRGVNVQEATNPKLPESPITDILYINLELIATHFASRRSLFAS